MGRSLAEEAASNARRIVADTNQFGTAGTLLPFGGGRARSISGIWRVGKSNFDQSKGTRIEGTADLLCSSEDVVARNDTFEVGNESWQCTIPGQEKNGLKSHVFKFVKIINQGVNHGTNFK